MFSKSVIPVKEDCADIIHLEAHAKCDRTANETGGVKSAVDEGNILLDQILLVQVLTLAITESGKWRCPTCAGSGTEPGHIPNFSISQKGRSRRISAGMSFCASQAIGIIRTIVDLKCEFDRQRRQFENT